MSVQASEMYKLYREVPLFEALFDSLVELRKNDLISDELVTLTVHTYDQAIKNVVMRCENDFIVVGKVAVYRIYKEHYWFVLSDASIYLQPPEGTRQKKKTKKLPKFGKKIGKFDHIKFWCYDQLHSTSMQLSGTEAQSNPYVIKVEKKVKEKRKKLKPEPKKKVAGGFNPLLHTVSLGKKEKDIPKQDFSLPMPYNEKLRRARGRLEDITAIAESQVGIVEVTKGRFRRKHKEYPFRCIESEERRMVDKSVVSGSDMVKRKYKVVLKSQDKFIAEMAVDAGGSLAMMGHNIHVAEDTDMNINENVVHKRYGTRRKNRIEHATFNTLSDYTAIVEEVKKKCVSTSESDSSSEDEVTFTEEPQDIDHNSVDNAISVKETICRPKSKQFKKPLMKTDEKWIVSNLSEISVKSKDSKVSICREKIGPTQTPEDDFSFLDDLVIDQGDGKTAEEEKSIEMIMKPKIEDVSPMKPIEESILNSSVINLDIDNFWKASKMGDKEEIEIASNVSDLHLGDKTEDHVENTSQGIAEVEVVEMFSSMHSLNDTIDLNMTIDYM